MNVMLRTVDKAADAPRQAELISETLARFAHDLRAEAIPAEVRERAKHLILDATGIALASGRYDFAHKAATGHLRARRRGPRARDRPAAAAAGARCSAPQRHPRARPRLRRHPHRRRHPCHGQPVAGDARPRPTCAARPAPTSSPPTSPASRQRPRLAAVGSGPFHQLGFHPTGLIGVFGCTLAAGMLMGLSPQAPGDGAGHLALDGGRQPGVPGGRRLDQAHASGLGGAVGHHGGGAGAAGLRGPIARLRGPLRPVQGLPAGAASRRSAGLGRRRASATSGR